MVQEITVDSSGATGSKPSSKTIFILVGVILILAAAGGVAWVLWNQKKKEPPTSPGRSKGSNWICVTGSMGDTGTHSSDGDYCKLSYAREGDYCKHGDGVGSCTLNPAPAAGTDPTKLACTDTTTPDAKTCSDYCYNKTDAVYALWNTSDKSCACRPTRSDIYWDRCVYDLDEGYTTCAASENTTNCSTVPMITPVPGYVAGSITAIAGIYTPTAEKCALEVASRNLESTDDGEVMGVFESGVTNANNCFIKTADLNLDPLADCKMSAEGKYSLILPTPTSEMDAVCIPTRPITIEGNIDTNPSLRPTVRDGAKSQNTCVKICGDGNLQTQETHKFSQPASKWDGTTCNCYDWPIGNVCGDQVSGTQFFSRIQLRSGLKDPLNPYWNDTTPAARVDTIKSVCSPPFNSGSCTCGDDGNSSSNSCAPGRNPVCTHLYKDNGGYACTCVGGTNASFATWTAATYANQGVLHDADCVGGQVIGSYIDHSISPNQDYADFCGLRNSQGSQPAGSPVELYENDEGGDKKDYCVPGTHYVPSPDADIAKYHSGFCQLDGF